MFMGGFAMFMFVVVSMLFSTMLVAVAVTVVCVVIPVVFVFVVMPVVFVFVVVSMLVTVTVPVIMIATRVTLVGVIVADDTLELFFFLHRSDPIENEGFDSEQVRRIDFAVGSWYDKG